MSEPELTTDLVKRVRDGEENAQDRLLAHTRERQRERASRRKSGYPLLRNYPETDDVIQELQIRLFKVLSSHPPTSAAHYRALWRQMTRRILGDFVRMLRGRNGRKAQSLTNLEIAVDGEKLLDLLRVPGEDTMCLDCWAAFHECAAKLPNKEREVFHLVWYSSKSQGETAKLLGVSPRTVKRRWRRARILVSVCLTDSAGGCCCRSRN
jgi:RNA polymerase sigma factor (sigma-70 family)